ncbi:hypothetical protein A0H81_11078 [Grifola frondosa]|uniref:TIGR04076 family protein n=1 Tax=Grifola frondosa TaxID=5627 RepID=A0A1C7LWW3_GRIFR|nr:hypothetical protein A0H81_11078 [Grifola frondosa]
MHSGHCIAPTTASAKVDDSFELFDLRVEDRVFLSTLWLTQPTTRFPGAVLPLLAAKQRVTSGNDWMSTDAEIACPDPHCPSRLRIIRTGVRKFNHGDVTVAPRLHPTVVADETLRGPESVRDVVDGIVGK